MSSRSFRVGPGYSGSRADVFLAVSAPELSRSFIQKMIREGNISVNGMILKKPGERLLAGADVILQLPEASELSVVPQNIPLDILYEDADILVVNKPKGMVVHPAAGHEDGTLVNALLYHCKTSLSGINGVLRPGIVHRIDKDTTGGLIICKNDLAHTSISEQLSVHSITRKYRTIVHGNLKKKELTIDAPVGRHPVKRKKMAVNHQNGKKAVTDVRVLEYLNGYTYAECSLHTGRTHQIRVHMAHIGHPVLGDEAYGPRRCPVQGLCGQTLHAYLTGFLHPRTGEYMEITAPLPEYFTRLLKRLS